MKLYIQFDKDERLTNFSLAQEIYNLKQDKCFRDIIDIKVIAKMLLLQCEAESESKR